MFWQEAFLFSGGKFWIGLGLSALLALLFFVTVDVGDMIEALADANYLYVAPAIGLYLIGVVFRTMRWQALLRHIKHVSNRRLFPVVVIGYMANNLLADASGGGGAELLFGRARTDKQEFGAGDDIRRAGV